MKVSFNWLKKYVDLEGITPEALADKMTLAGVEVESVRHLASATNLVIGQVITCGKHPDSDHLHVLRVDEGPKFGIHQIVCGAPNARTGLRVIVAREGAVLPTETIEKTVIRGVDSDGMCCSLLELGVDKSTLSEQEIQGIEELPSDAPVGSEDVLAYLGLDDVILDLKLLANRSDLNALENVAREAGAILSRRISLPSDPVVKTEKSSFSVASATPLCPLFAAYEVDGIKTAPSPRWLQNLLTAEGIRSINNVVDIGNYVMLLTGQPLNMYDADKLTDNALVCTDSFSGEFKAMDEKTYSLIKGDLVIMSGSTPACLAGIMTSQACAVSSSTKHVIIEAAIFQGATIRHTSNRLGLSSESSSRFVKGLNPDQADRVLQIASSLMKDLCQASSVKRCSFYDTISHTPKTILTSLSYLNSRLGTAFTLDEVVNTLKRDNLEVACQSGDKILVAVPSYRIDMEGQADVSEEVIRLLGFDYIKSQMPSVFLTTSGGFSLRQQHKKAIRRFLRNQGLWECLTYSLVNDKEKNSFCYLSPCDNYHLRNPMTDDHAYLRTSLLRSLLDAASYNYSRQEKDLALYEISDVDSPSCQGLRLAVVLVGSESIMGSLFRRSYDFFSAKGLFEGIISLLGLAESRFHFSRLESGKPEFHPGRSALVSLGKKPIAVMGELHPTALESLGLGKNAVGLELDLDALLDLKTSAEKATVPPKFPFVSRDLAFTLDRKISFADVKHEIMRLDHTIASCDIFDLYEGSNIASGKKSIALSLTFSSPDKTLTDTEVATIMEKIEADLKTRFGAEVRR